MAINMRPDAARITLTGAQEFSRPGNKSSIRTFWVVGLPAAERGPHDEPSFWPIRLRDTLSRANVSRPKSARVLVN
jgi:hypothetical protein